MAQTSKLHSNLTEQKSKIKSQKMTMMGFLRVELLMKWGLNHGELRCLQNAKSRVEEGYPAHLFVFFHEAY
jgi:hypothetical protein